MSIQIQRNGTWQEVSKQEFLGLVSQGVIRPDTAVIINDQQVVAARLKGVVFPSQVAVPPPAAPQASRAVPVPHSAPQLTRTTNSSAIIAEIAVIAVAGIVCLALLLSKVGGGNVINFCLGNVIPSTLTAAERAETDGWIEGRGRGAIVYYLRSLGSDKDTDYNLVLKYLKYFVSQGADVNAKDNEGITPLYYAVMSGNVDVVKFLVSKGADANAKVDKDGQHGGSTPLHEAVRSEKNIEVVKILVSQGADVNAKDKGGWSSLHTAAIWGDIEIIKLLVSKGVDVNAKGEQVATPLYGVVDMCSFRRNTIDPSERERMIDVIRFLVSKGADVNAKSRYSYLGSEYRKEMTPLDMANEPGMEEIARILSGGGARN